MEEKKIILINHFHLNFKPTADQRYISGANFKNICSENFLQLIIKVSAVDFTSSKISYFQYILLSTFRRMHLNYENCFFRSILF